MNTAERLVQYYSFDDDVLGAVSEAAEWQNRLSYDELTAHYASAGIMGEVERIVPDGSKKPIEFLTFTPQDDYDEKNFHVLHLAMATEINPNTIMHGMRLFGANPDAKLMIVGNPAAPGKNAGVLTVGQSVESMRAHSLRLFTEPLLRHLEAEGVSAATQLGFSYGADKAAATAGEAERFDIEVPNGVFMEPVSGDKRHSNHLMSLLRLAQEFGVSSTRIAQYIEQSESPAYQQVRDQEGSLGLAKYALGLFRLSNLAVASTMAAGGFDVRVRKGLESQPEMRATLAWGTASELSNDELMGNIALGLGAEFGGDRVGSMRIKGMHHAGGDDIDLHAAMIVQALKR